MISGMLSGLTCFQCRESQPTFPQGESKVASAYELGATGKAGIAESVDPNILSDTLNQSKPLGTFGDITLNEICTKVKDFNWEVISDVGQITIHGAPSIVNVVNYTLLMRGYVKFVYNRPYTPNLNPQALHFERLSRNKNLAVFALVGAPLLIVSSKFVAVKLKDMITLDLPFPSRGETSTVLENSGIEGSPNNLNNSTLTKGYTSREDKVLLVK